MMETNQEEAREAQDSEIENSQESSGDTVVQRTPRPKTTRRKQEPIKPEEVKPAYPATAFTHITHKMRAIGMMKKREAFIMKKLGLK